MSDSDILYEVQDGIGRLVFNRPQAHNALTFAMYDRLVEVCVAANTDRSLKALIITGAGGRAFASGTDISQFRAFKTVQHGIDYEKRVEEIMDAIERCRVPTIAAIAGLCTGGGAAIAACCDLRIGTRTTKIGVPIARTLGNCLSIANLRRLAALIGAARVKEMMFTARLIEAPEALSIGLLSEVVEDDAALQTRVAELARQMAGYAPLTLELTKEGLRRLQQGSSDDEDIIRRCYESQDFQEGLEAFLAKRPPRWRGE